MSAYSDCPTQAKQIEQLANWQGVNFERIVAMKLDAVLAWRGGNPDRQVNQLVSLGFSVIWLAPKIVADVEAALRQLAPSSPTPEKTLKAAADLSRQFSELKARYGRPQSKGVPAVQPAATVYHQKRVDSERSR